jgi:6-phosphogluconolactonase
MSTDPVRGPRAERVVAAEAELYDELARRLEQESERALAARGRFTLGLSGGGLAERSFPRLSRAALDDGRTDYFWIDDRAVPPDHPDSNYAQSVRLWLGPAGVPTARIHRMRGEADDLELAAEEYAGELARICGDPPRLDVVLVGVGPDGHVASLFPGSRQLEVEDRSVVAVLDSPKPPPRRLTLTLPVLADAGLVLVAMLGASKSPAMRAALDDPASGLPIARLLRRARRAVVLLDPAAAGTAGLDR